MKKKLTPIDGKLEFKLVFESGLVQVGSPEGTGRERISLDANEPSAR